MYFIKIEYFLLLLNKGGVLGSKNNIPPSQKNVLNLEKIIFHMKTHLNDWYYNTDK